MLLIVVVSSCKQKSVYRYKATDGCNNLELFVGRLFPNETVSLYYNKELILRYKTDSLDGFRFKRHFCIDYQGNGRLKIVSEYNNKTYIDTMLNVRKDKFGYLLTVSLPHPKDWKGYYEEKSPVPTKEWGSLAIDDCVRLVSLNPDTVLKETWIDKVYEIK
jgi:hypothetical protein